MKTKYLLAVCPFLLVVQLAGAQGSAFTYEGRLNDGTNVANGSYDLRFYLRDALTAGVPVGPTNTVAPVLVINGLFTVALDFGSGIFTGPSRWLEIGVRTNGSVVAYTTLSPRQQLTPVPYAIYAANAAQVGGQASTAFVAKAGDTMTGTLNLPANGLDVGGSQLVASGGNVTVGGALVVDRTGLNNGAVNPGLTFGIGSGEGISSKRTGGANQFGLDLYTGFSARLSIASGGNVGIGTTTPALPLQVSQAGPYGRPAVGVMNGTNAWSYLLADNSWHNSLVWDAARDMRFGTEAGVGSTYTEWVRITKAGNVGIGTASPDRPLTIQPGVGNELVTLKDNTGANRWHLNLQDGGLNFAQSFVADGRLFLGSNGNIGIGTPSPQAKLDVAGTVKMDGLKLGTASTIGSVLTSSDAAGNGGWESGLRVLNASRQSGLGQPITSSRNLVGGYNNVVASGAIGATALGGGFVRTTGTFPGSVLAAGSNYVSGDYATVIGGVSNVAAGSYSFAAGQQAKALHNGSFVWADFQNADFKSSAANQFLIRAQGGVGIGTASPGKALQVGDASIRGAEGMIRLGSHTPTANTVARTWDLGVPQTDDDASGIGYSFVIDDTSLGAGPEFMIKYGTGNVGIGTESPKQRLHVNGDYYGKGHFWLHAYEGDGSSGTAYVQARDDSTTSSISMVLRTKAGTTLHDAIVLGTDGSTTVKVLTITGGSDLAEPFQMSHENIPKGSLVIIDDENPGKLKLAEQAYDTRVAGIVSGANGVNAGITLHQEGLIAGGQNVALSGRVYALADASNGPIKPGDLLTSSATSGHVMRVGDHAKAQGAIVGKAMSALKQGRGMVLVLVSLQ